ASAVAMRAVGQGLGLAVATQYALDSVLLTATIAIGALFTYRWLWLCAALTAAGGLVGAFWPDIVHITFGAANCAAILLAAVLLPRSRREALS
ncbi:MAG TPA: hypothetical protein VFU21_26725, partial [Kofleriaceae bacterium]|nr:hypothetical protein [Kofleriaceae bacterium]